uniref:Cytokine receptor like factor 3 n=1 Tax=Gallus gallus TaxID=9031 RepID=Q5ZKM7_CHICK|nr:hypothetical protein RCJMB04_10a8 [Gallus gallus]
MEAETEARLLLQEARESIEAARSYRRELQQRLRGLHQARQQSREAELCSGRGGSLHDLKRKCASPNQRASCVGCRDPKEAVG